MSQDLREVESMADVNNKFIDNNKYHLMFMTERDLYFLKSIILFAKLNNFIKESEHTEEQQENMCNRILEGLDYFNH